MALPLWSCDTCGRTFANRSQSHFCGSTKDLDRHFHDSNPEVRRLFEAFAAAVHACGPVTVIPEKTRIAFQVQMPFAAITPREHHLSGHFVFARRIENPRFPKIEAISPKNQVHYFRLQSCNDIDEQFRGWIREAYAVGQQKHLAEVHSA